MTKYPDVEGGSLCLISQHGGKVKCVHCFNKEKLKSMCADFNVWHALKLASFISTIPTHQTVQIYIYITKEKPYLCTTGRNIL